MYVERCDDMRFFQKVYQKGNELSISEKEVLDYLLQNDIGMKSFSVENIALLSKSSPATVVRMCKRLGYNGFKDFKVEFLKTNKKQLLSSITPFDFSNMDETLNKVNSLTEKIKSEATIIDKEFADTMFKARRILIYYTYDLKYIAEFISSRLNVGFYKKRCGQVKVEISLPLTCSYLIETTDLILVKLFERFESRIKSNRTY